MLGSFQEVVTIDRSARLRAVLVLSLVTAVLVLPTLGRRPIATSDEARFALLAQHILDRDTWTGACAEVRGHLRGQDFLVTRRAAKEPSVARLN